MVCGVVLFLNINQGSLELCSRLRWSIGKLQKVHSAVCEKYLFCIVQRDEYAESHILTTKHTVLVKKYVF